MVLVLLVCQVGNKRVFIDLKKNKQGVYLKLSEKGANVSSWGSSASSSSSSSWWWLRLVTVIVIIRFIIIFMNIAYHHQQSTHLVPPWKPLLLPLPPLLLLPSNSLRLCFCPYVVINGMAGQ